MNQVRITGSLRRRTKLLWGWAGLGPEALDLSRSAWLVYFYAPPAGAAHRGWLPLITVTALLFAGKLFEAFADTLVGYWSDRTRTRFGRRIPFIVLAAPPTSLFAFLLFTPPANYGHAVAAAYLFVTLELYYLGNSLVSVPFESLLPEIGRTSEERLSLSAWRVYCSVLGAAIGLIGSGLLVSHAGFRAMALVMAALALTSRYLGVAAAWRRAERESPPSAASLKMTLRLSLANRGFLVFMLSFVLFSTALAMLIGLLPYWVDSVLRERDTGTWSGILTAVAIGSMGLAIPLFGRLARRTSAEQAYRWAMLAAALAFPLLFVAGRLPGVSPVTQTLAVMVLAGAPLAGVYLFPGPIIADFCDAEARLLGLRREGMFFSTQSFLDKITEAFAPLLLGLILLLGDRPGDLLGVRLVGPAAGLLVLAGYLSLRRSAFGLQLAPHGGLETGLLTGERTGD